MNYEIEGKLNNKADKCELYNVQNENRELRGHINQLEREIEALKGISQNRYYVFERLFNILSEHPSFSYLQDEIYELKGII